MNGYPFSALKILEGSHINLRPLRIDDCGKLRQALMSPTTWMVAERGIVDEAAFEKYFDALLARQEKFEGLTLVGRINETDEITSMSTFCNLGPNLLKLEIGFTWVGDKWRRTFVNTEQKLLMLTCAFETLKVKRVEFSVDPMNAPSNAAMKRIGATLEGTLRKWRFLSENDRGDRNLYSILDDEWPATKNLLQGFLARHL